MRHVWEWWWSSPPGRYSLRVLLAIDQLGNTLAGGHEDETISSRIGRAKLDALAEGRKLSLPVRVLDRFLDWLDPNHSIDAIEISGDEAREWLEKYPGRRLLVGRSGQIVGIRTG